MKFIIFMIFTLFSIEAIAGLQNCGVVNIDKVLSGPRHGSMMLVSNRACGNRGWVCLDPDAEHMSSKESDRLFAFILTNKMASKKIAVHAYTDIYSTACGSYPVVEDVRTP